MAITKIRLRNSEAVLRKGQPKSFPRGAELTVGTHIDEGRAKWLVTAGRADDLSKEAAPTKLPEKGAAKGAEG